APQALRESEQRYKELADLLPQTVFEMDRRGKLTFVNRMAFKNFGYSEKDFDRGLYALDMIAPEDQAAAKKDIARVLQGNRLIREFRMRRIEGTTFPALVDATPILRDRTARGLRGIVVDMTEQKKMEERLRSSKRASERLALVNNVMAELSRLITSTLHIEDVYPRFASTVGEVIPLDRVAVCTLDKKNRCLTLQYISGPAVTNLKAGDSFPLRSSLLERILRTAKTLVVQGAKARKTALRSPIQRRAYRAGFRSAIFTPLIYLGEIFGFLILRSKTTLAYTEEDVRLSERIARQISGAVYNTGLLKDFESTQEALRESRARYRAVVDDQTDLVCRFLPDGTLTFVNRAYCEYLESTPQKLLGINFMPFLPREYRNRLRLHLRTLTPAEPVGAPQENPVTLPNGETRWFQWVNRAIPDRSGAIVEFQAVGHDITILKKAENRLKEQSESLRALSARLEKIREEERTAIAREIHDELGQSLTALKMDLAWLVRMPRSRRGLARKVQAMSALVDTVIKSVRKISSALRPGVLDDLGLRAALEWQCREFQTRTGIECRFASSAGNPEIDRNVSTGVFRIFQESLTNVARHAQANEVKVRLTCREKMLKLSVEDDGRGITREEMENPKSLGILGMKERAYLLGGRSTIRGKPRKGTRILLEVPLRTAWGERGQRRK
ncbi:MAG TPA: PAS domain S-box protein, partial [Thermodesulfobacteriota bacterium]|nr:PAS domain S-box protein [Thermodesulfobacteriota bacterium]